MSREGKQEAEGGRGQSQERPRKRNTILIHGQMCVYHPPYEEKRDDVRRQRGDNPSIHHIHVYHSPFILFLFPLSIFFFYLSFLPFLSFLFFSISFILSSSLLHLLPSLGHLCSSGVLSFLLVRARSLCSVHAFYSLPSSRPFNLRSSAVPYPYNPSYTIVTTPLPKPQVQAPSPLSLFSTP